MRRSISNFVMMFLGRSSNGFNFESHDRILVWIQRGKGRFEKDYECICEAIPIESEDWEDSMWADKGAKVYNFQDTETLRFVFE